MISIRRGRSGDAEALAAVGERTFRDTYTAFNTPEDMTSYVSANFTTEALARELVDPRVTYLLGTENDTLVAYAKLFDGAPPSCVTGKKPLEISRFYVVRELHGTGAAKVLMNACLIEARRLGARTVWLGVWEKNERARAFYAKHGFADVGEHEFLLGNDVQRDRVLVRSA